MQELYNNTVANMAAYMYPKTTRVLDVHPADCVGSSTTQEEVPSLSDLKDMLKADLIAYVLERFGDDADVKGTKAEIIERHFC